MAVHDELSKLITPDLLTLVFDARMDISKTARLNWSKAGPLAFNDEFFAERIKDRAWPVLMAISKLGLDKVPDFMTFLPPPSAPNFPEQCLGLQLLLDQAPRTLFKGMDARWTRDYFDVLSQRLCRSWHALDEESRPDTWQRWWGLGVTVDFVVQARMYFGAPFVHSEHSSDHVIARAFTEDTRLLVEDIADTKDPHRAERDKILADEHGFLRTVMAGPPNKEGTTLEDFTWWMCMVMDLHEGIVSKYGRYPYANSWVGRDSTPEEEEWLNEEKYVGVAPEDVAKRIKEDVKNGSRTPLGESWKN